MVVDAGVFKSVTRANDFGIATGTDVGADHVRPTRTRLRRICK